MDASLVFSGLAILAGVAAFFFFGSWAFYPLIVLIMVLIFMAGLGGTTYIERGVPAITIGLLLALLIPGIDAAKRKRALQQQQPNATAK